MKIIGFHCFSMVFNAFSMIFIVFQWFSLFLMVFNGFSMVFIGFSMVFIGGGRAAGMHGGGVRAAGTHRRLCRVPGESAWMSSPCVNPWTANAGLICPWSDRLLKLQEPTEVKRHRARLVLGWGTACCQLFPAHLPSYRMSPDPPP